MANSKRRQRLQSKLSTKLTTEVKLKKLKNLDYDPEIFKTMTTQTVVDDFWSTKGGVPKACNFIAIGDPGVGKSTVTLDILANLHLEGQRVLFISAEMTEVDLYEYMERYPKFGEVDILFLGDYTDENPKLVIEETLKNGYDVVLGDSFAEIEDEIKESCFMSSKQAEKWLIDLMLKHNKGENDVKAYTTFIMIQQMTKGGKFVGSNKLKHNTTGMLHIKFDGDNENAPRYLEFSKNRRGQVNKRLYFELDAKNDVRYLEGKWYAEEENRERMNLEVEELAKEAAEFDKFLNDDIDDSTQADENVEMTSTVEEEVAA